MTDGPFEVVWAGSPLRSLDRLPEKIATACIEFVYGGLSLDPRRVGWPLRFELEGKHSARRGDFRVIYDIDDAGHSVTVLVVDHRSDVYRPR